MKILWYTDTHFGLSGAFSRPSSSGYTTRLDETMEVHRWVADKVEEVKPDLVIQGGDIYKPQVTLHGMEVSASVRGTNKIISRTGLVGGLHITLLGNHDYISRDTKVTSIDWIAELPDSKLIKTIDVMEVDEGEALLVFCPYLWDYDAAMERIAELMKDATGYERCYFFGHAEIGGALDAVSVDLGTGEEKKHFSDNANAIPPKFLSEIFDLSFNGHHHIPQKPEDNIYLSGSLQQFKVTEYANRGLERGVYVIDTKTSEVDFIENKISPKIVRVENNLEKLEEIPNNTYVIFYFQPKEFDKEELKPKFRRFKGYQLKQISPDKFRPITSVDFESKDEDNTGIYKEYLDTVAFESRQLEKKVEQRGLEIVKKAEEEV